MAFLLACIPHQRCLVRAEYTRDLADGHGTYYAAVAHAVRCEPGLSPAFRVAFTGEAVGSDGTRSAADTGGAMFSLLPLAALCRRPCAPAPLAELCPWDCFSDVFAVVELDFLVSMRVLRLPDRAAGRYLFSIDYTGSSLARDREQHKEHHVVELADGAFGAYPNNRMLWDDPAYCTATERRPPFVSLTGEFRAE